MKSLPIAMTLLTVSLVLPALLLLTLLFSSRGKRRALADALYPQTLEKVP